MISGPFRGQRLNTLGGHMEVIKKRVNKFGTRSVKQISPKLLTLISPKMFTLISPRTRKAISMDIDCNCYFSSGNVSVSMDWTRFSWILDDLHHSDGGLFTWRVCQMAWTPLFGLCKVCHQILSNRTTSDLYRSNNGR